MKLLIVESPTKARHIQHFLGSDWQVKASLGHIRDLETSGDNSYVRPPDFQMHYCITDSKHQEIVSGLKAAAARASAVYLATDPDREGEAIAWHLCQVLKIKAGDAQRVTYQEVTEQAVKKAIQHPRPLNMKLVAAQEVRRGLDRMVGWEVSGPLSNMVHQKASAGRVQTPALRLIVERERTIQSFHPTHWQQVQAIFPGPRGDWTATWIDGCNPKEGQYFQDAAYAQALAAAVPGLPFVVINSVSKPARKAPPPPFTTSALQMDGSRALHCGAEDIMKAAQALFEAGAITYHRTDSPNLSVEGEELLRDTLQSIGLPMVETPRRWKAKGDAQEAHEAIRPTAPDTEQAGSTALEQALYQLIRKRALASQMPDAVYQQTGCILDAGTFQDRPAQFKAGGSVLTDPGWKQLYQESADAPDEDAESGDKKTASNPVPMLEKGTRQTASQGQVLDKVTQAPPRYTEATLIKALEDHGVGRPSTYASILKTLYKREYIYRKGKKPSLYPTPLGHQVIDAVSGVFDFADVGWTRDMENGLDGITQGQTQPRALLQSAWDAIQKSLEGLPEAARHRTQSAAETRPCPVEGCGGTVKRLESRKKKGKFFWACSNKDKHNLLADNKGKPGQPFGDK